MSVVIISGPIGAGKTSVARELLASSRAGSAYIEGDTFWQFLAKPLPSQNDHERLMMIMRAMLAAAWHYHRDGYEVLVDFSMPPGYLDAAKKLLRGEPFHFVVLRPGIDVCIARASSRAEGRIADYGKYRDFYDIFDAEDRFLLCDDVATAQTLAKRVRSGIYAGTYVVTT